MLAFVHSYYDFTKCSIVILPPLVQFENQLVLKDKMKKTVSLKPVKA